MVNHFCIQNGLICNDNNLYKTEKQLFRIIIMMMDPRGKWQALRSEVVGGDSFTT